MAEGLFVMTLKKGYQEVSVLIKLFYLVARLQEEGLMWAMKKEY